LKHCIGALQIAVDFELGQPWTILFGPSGSGKTTILRAIAGLLKPDSGRVMRTPSFHGDREFRSTLLDTATGVFVPAHRRSVRFATQKANLFPHMTVRDNTRYGMCFTGRDVEEGESFEQKVNALCARFRLASMMDKFPGELSGGEGHRVNLVRAVAAASQILLLDEPFTGLDAALRSELMHDLLAWAAERNLCVLSVTHDVAEAFQLGAEVIKIADGKVVEQGPVEVVLAEERKRLLGQLGEREADSLRE
jgi:molybdate transport system ATP-binding protein